MRMPVLSEWRHSSKKNNIRPTNELEQKHVLYLYGNYIYQQKVKHKQEEEIWYKYANGQEH